MKVLVAMSGGVDSAVSAHLIKQHHEAIGVTMKLHDETDNLIYGENSCCSNQDIADAKSVCDLVGITLFSINQSFFCRAPNFLAAGGGAMVQRGTADGRAPCMSLTPWRPRRPLWSP